MPYRNRAARGWAIIFLIAGCVPADAPPPANVPAAQAPTIPSARRASATAARQAEVSGDTQRDYKFAEFVARTAGPMVKKVAVGIENKGTLRVEIGEATKPEDVLDLTKGLLAGARRDFPDRPIDASIYDPTGSAILHAHYKPGEGVKYEVAKAEAPATRPSSTPASAPPVAPGPSERDVKFAAWAEEHGKAYLRFVQADLDRNGRLWFGVNSSVKPADVPELTKSLLEGARREFPRRELMATVFDPEGDRIGRATLKADGGVDWKR